MRVEDLACREEMPQPTVSPTAKRGRGCERVPEPWNSRRRPSGTRAGMSSGWRPVSGKESEPSPMVQSMKPMVWPHWWPLCPRQAPVSPRVADGASLKGQLAVRVDSDLWGWGCDQVPAVSAVLFEVRVRVGSTVGLELYLGSATGHGHGRYPSPNSSSQSSAPASIMAYLRCCCHRHHCRYRSRGRHRHGARSAMCRASEAGAHRGVLPGCRRGARRRTRLTAHRGSVKPLAATA